MTALSEFLMAPLRLGEPDVTGPLAVFPVFGAPGRLEYRSFAEARAGGTQLRELDGSASVNDVLVANPLDVAVLLYEGEEMLGAQQNRVIDVSVLVAAGATTEVPVSCVERGRWDGARHHEPFAPAPQAAYPALRRAKNAAAAIAAEAGHAPRAAQSAVWSEVEAKAARLQAGGPTHALHDVFQSRRREVGELAAAIARRDGQIGMVAAIGGTVAVCDVVGRPDVLAALHGPLVQGYALDALEAPERPAPPSVVARAVLHRACRATCVLRPGVGLGEDVRFADEHVHGSALVAAGELVALTAYATG